MIIAQHVPEDGRKGEDRQARRARVDLRRLILVLTLAEHGLSHARHDVASDERKVCYWVHPACAG